LFDVVLPGGFPDHAHRGFEAINYLLYGEYCYEDFRNNKGVITAGDVQHVTTGKGLVLA
jgi:redox-sensitive bicupin YhaK (pirin superfamily)